MLRGPYIMAIGRVGRQCCWNTGFHSRTLVRTLSNSLPWSSRCESRGSQKALCAHGCISFPMSNPDSATRSNSKTPPRLPRQIMLKTKDMAVRRKWMKKHTLTASGITLRSRTWPSSATDKQRAIQLKVLKSPKLPQDHGYAISLLSSPELHSRS